MAEPAHHGVALRLYLAMSPLLAPVARRHLARRLARGKEDPARAAEKLGQPGLRRPEGPLIWMHAVGVGEVLALPGLITALRALRPDIHVLITSSSRTSAEALAPNLPPDTVHQFLPLDSLPFVRAFLTHWRPDVVIWAERDIWPALVCETARRRIPQALVNARMSPASYRSKTRLRGLFRDLYRQMVWIGVQDPETAAHFRSLGVAADRLTLDGSLKAGAAALADQPQTREALQAQLGKRRVWLAASTHPGDEAVVIAAHKALLAADPDACLIIAPRDPHRAPEVLAALQAAGLNGAITSDMTLPGRFPAYVVGRIGQMGLWYRLASAALIGGSLDDTGGHNPYEPARLGCAILHGPNVANFAADYARFHAAGAARLIRTAPDLTVALLDPALAQQCAPARSVANQGSTALQGLATRVLALMPKGARP